MTAIPFISQVAKAQRYVDDIMLDLTKALSPISEDGESISENERAVIIKDIDNAMYALVELKHTVERGHMISLYNKSVNERPDCEGCKSENIGSHHRIREITKELERLFELIDDKISQKDTLGTKACIQAIAKQFGQFSMLREVSAALDRVSLEVDELTKLDDLMCDMEKWFVATFAVRAEKPNAAIALGSIMSILPASEESEVEFF